MKLSVEPGLKGNQGSRVRNLIKPLQFISLVPSIHPIVPYIVPAKGESDNYFPVQSNFL